MKYPTVTTYMYRGDKSGEQELKKNVSSPPRGGTGQE